MSRYLFNSTEKVDQLAKLIKTTFKRSTEEELNLNLNKLRNCICMALGYSNYTELQNNLVTTEFRPLTDKEYIELEFSIGKLMIDLFAIPEHYLRCFSNDRYERQRLMCSAEKLCMCSCGSISTESYITNIGQLYKCNDCGKKDKGKGGLIGCYSIFEGYDSDNKEWVIRSHDRLFYKGTYPGGELKAEWVKNAKDATLFSSKEKESIERYELYFSYEEEPFYSKFIKINDIYELSELQVDVALNGFGKNPNFPMKITKEMAENIKKREYLYESRKQIANLPGRLMEALDNNSLVAVQIFERATSNNKGLYAFTSYSI